MAKEVTVVELNDKPEYQRLLAGAPQTHGIKVGRVHLACGCDCGLHNTENKEEVLVFLSGSGQALIEDNAPLEIGQGKIAYIPPNKKITSVDVYLDFVMAPTNTTIQVGIPGSTSYFIESAGTVGLSAVGALVGTKCISSATNRAGKLAGGYVTTGSTTTAIRMQLGVTAMTSPTAGTIRTIVRYT